MLLLGVPFKKVLYHRFLLLKELRSAVLLHMFAKKADFRAKRHENPLVFPETHYKFFYEFLVCHMIILSRFAQSFCIKRFQHPATAPAATLGYNLPMEKPPQNLSENSQEHFSSTVEIVTDKELKQSIYQGQYSPQDNRFISIENGGVFKYFDLKDIIGINSYAENIKLFPLVKVEGVVVGIAGLEQDPHNKENFWIKFISVDPAYQGNGYASILIKKIFEFAKENNYSLEPSFYSEEGRQKLKKVMEKYIQETGVRIINHRQ